MARALKCLRCGAGMHYVKTAMIQLGQTSWLFGDWPNLIAGAMEVDIYACPNCGKLELFQTEPAAEPLQIAQRTCPVCGKTHDADYPRCPFCRHAYTGR
ncbi:MAG: hypothetical protein MR033_00450 [Clostridiales bacterium]|nr:hypothetical protein [Clostridiales bacterium]